MAKRILVRLDKSETSETVLPLVAGLASAMGATVRLLHVEPEAKELIDRSGRVLVHIDQDAARLEVDGMDYLAGMAGRLPGLAVERAVRFGDPVREILTEAESFGADLIAVTTTGRSGLRRAVLGSVAEQVFAPGH
jgi:nucleotide-binding universal stress UspA family protein